MTERQALAAAMRKFGKRAAVESKARTLGPSSEVTRQEASAALVEWRAVKPTFTELEQWPRETTVGEYLDARAAFRKALAEWKGREGQLLHVARYHAFRVFTCGALFATVVGEGDSWEDALDKAGAR